jgi:glycosyltransferase involved in cell wall biosynthesis
MKQTNVKWITSSGSARSCAVVRGAIPAGMINGSQHWRIEVKDEHNLYPYDVGSADIMVFQRCFGDEIIPHIRKCRSKGIKTVFDVDDALWLLPNETEKSEIAKFGGLSITEATTQKMFSFMENEVDAVTCSTEQLAFAIRRVCHPRSLYVVPNYIDHRYFYPIDMGKSPEDRKNILWYAANGHNYNAGLLCRVVEKLLQSRRNVEITLLGCVDQFSEIKPLLVYGNRVQIKPWVDYFTLGMYIANADIVLCPVIDAPFTECKSEIKAVEAGACNVPVLMSDVPQYRRFADRVLTSEEKAAVLLPPDENAWLTALHSLLDGTLTIPNLHKRVNNEYGAMRCIEMWTECYRRILAN